MSIVGTPNSSSHSSSMCSGLTWVFGCDSRSGLSLVSFNAVLASFFFEDPAMSPPAFGDDPSSVWG